VRSRPVEDLVGFPRRILPASSPVDLGSGEDAQQPLPLGVPLTAAAITRSAGPNRPPYQRTGRSIHCVGSGVVMREVRSGAGARGVRMGYGNQTDGVLATSIAGPAARSKSHQRPIDRGQLRPIHKSKTGKLFRGVPQSEPSRGPSSPEPVRDPWQTTSRPPRACRKPAAYAPEPRGRPDGRKSISGVIRPHPERSKRSRVWARGQTGEGRACRGRCLVGGGVGGHRRDDSPSAPTIAPGTPSRLRCRRDDRDQLARFARG